MRIWNFAVLQYNDVAILTLESPVFFTQTISPVCLPPSGSNDQYTDKDAAVIGWGALKEGKHSMKTRILKWSHIFDEKKIYDFIVGGGQPSVLQQVTVQIITNAKCKSSYGSDAPGGIVDHMLCAAYPGKDSCSVRTFMITHVFFGQS